MAKNSRLVIICLTALILTTLTLIGITYAYYTTNFVNSTVANFEGTSGFAGVIYDDGNGTFKTDHLTTGEIGYKTFTVTNNNAISEIYGVKFENVNNELNSKTKENLYYTLSCSSKNKITNSPEGDCTSISSHMPLPVEDGYILSNSIGINQVHSYTLKLYNKSTPENEAMSFNVKINIGDYKKDITNAEGTLWNKIYTTAQNKISATLEVAPKTIVGKESSNSSEKSLVTGIGDYGKMYYFRGNVDNNYLSIGSTCWRIVSLQGDGSIKIILENPVYSCNGTSEYLPSTDSNLLYKYLSQSKTQNGLFDSVSYYGYKIQKDSSYTQYYADFLLNSNYEHVNTITIKRNANNTNLDYDYHSSKFLTEYFYDRNEILNNYNNNIFREQIGLCNGNNCTYPLEFSDSFLKKYFKQESYCIGDMSSKVGIIGEDDNEYYYSSYIRKNDSIVSLACPVDFDRTPYMYGGMLTLDEYAYAGANIKDETNLYSNYLDSGLKNDDLCNNTDYNSSGCTWLLLTPLMHRYDNGIYKDVVAAATPYGLKYIYVDQIFMNGQNESGGSVHTRPVYVLKSGVKYNSGNGTKLNPYVIGD